MILRPYQLRSLEALRAARRAGHRRILLASPTGSGKTVLACEIIRTALTHGQRILVIAHRKELLDQFYVHLTRQGITPGLMRAQDERTDPSQPVQLASISTLVRRDLPPADLVLVDEAHRCPGDSYARTLEAYPQATIIGLTATPCRTNGEPLREHFDTLVIGAHYSELIDEGAIVAPIVYAPHAPVDLSNVGKRSGDYAEDQLEAVMRQPHVIGDVVQEWLDKAEGRSTVVFAVGIDHSRELCDEFRAHGVRSAHLDGTTSEDERLQILVDLEVGRLDVVCNVGVLCEGWDQPRVKCCSMARPTLSLTLHMQTAGRILRPWGDRPPILLDHAGNVARHGLPHEDREWSLDGKAKLVRPSPYRTCPKCYGYVDRSPCPICGFAPPAAKREVRKQDGVLSRIDAAIAAERQKDPKRSYFDKKVDEARRKGFKPGFASAQYKEKFGDWPPWSWSQEVKSQLDEEWLARIEKRSREREFWQGQQEERLRKLEQSLPPLEEEA